MITIKVSELIQDKDDNYKCEMAQTFLCVSVFSGIVL